MNYHFDVINEKIKGRPDLRLYTGNVNTYSFDFNFDEHWQGLLKFVTFNSGTDTYVIELVNNSIIVPQEILTEAGICSFGVYGTNADDDIKRISSNIIEFEIANGAYSDGLTPAIPTPDLWETLFRNSIPIIKDNYWYLFDLNEKKYINTNIKVTGGIPEKGVDYFTDEEKAELTNQILTNINISNYATKAELTNKVDKEDGFGLSRIVDFVAGPNLGTDYSLISALTRGAGVQELKLYNKEQVDTKLANKVDKEDGFGLSKIVDFVAGPNPGTDYCVFSALVRGVGEQGFALYNKDQIDDKLATKQSTNIPKTLAVNTVYSAENFDDLTLNLPKGEIGNFIQVDFVTNDTPPTLTITSTQGISDCDLIPEANMIYSLHFNWGILNYNSTTSAYEYGWRFDYSEYTKTIA